MRISPTRRSQSVGGRPIGSGIRPVRVEWRQHDSSPLFNHGTPTGVYAGSELSFRDWNLCPVRIGHARFPAGSTPHTRAGRWRRAGYQRGIFYLRPRLHTHGLHGKRSRRSSRSLNSPSRLVVRPIRQSLHVRTRPGSDRKMREPRGQYGLADRYGYRTDRQIRRALIHADIFPGCCGCWARCVPGRMRASFTPTNDESPHGHQFSA